MSELKNQISQFIDTKAKVYQDISLAIHAKPEVSDFEYFASQTLSEQLKKEGFEIELPAAGHRTGFAATYKSNKPGPTVVFLAEYDALAGLGHGCGHNVFGATSSLAGAALKKCRGSNWWRSTCIWYAWRRGWTKWKCQRFFCEEGIIKRCGFCLMRASRLRARRWIKYA